MGNGESKEDNQTIYEVPEKQNSFRSKHSYIKGRFN